MRKDLLQWQWSLYPDNHRARSTLLVHLFAVPLFMWGTLAVVTAFWTSAWMLGVGLFAMAGAMALQGRTHKRESVAPVPFASKGDALSRIFVEQWITFPRFVLSGEWLRAWRRASPGS